MPSSKHLVVVVLVCVITGNLCGCQLVLKVNVFCEACKGGG